VDQTHFNALTQTLTNVPPRRDVLRGLAGVALSLVAFRLSDAEAGKKKGRKKKKSKKQRGKKRNPPGSTPQEVPPLVFNQYGCIDVDRPCRGDSTNCCSGICQGAAPAAGQPDASRCAAHNDGVCTVEINSCDIGVEVRCDPANTRGVCTLTTGNAAFCADISAGVTKHCRFCAKDTDCQTEFGPGAACVVLGGECTPLCSLTGRTACLPPSP
jgi:hypothetical protein